MHLYLSFENGNKAYLMGHHQVHTTSRSVYMLLSTCAVMHLMDTGGTACGELQ